MAFIAQGAAGLQAYCSAAQILCISPFAQLLICASSSTKQMSSGLDVNGSEAGQRPAARILRE